MRGKALQASLFDSLQSRDGNVNNTNDILAWINDLNTNTKVSVTETNISDDSFWFYDDYKGEILNRKRSFFSITGMRYFIDGTFITEQPIIIQNEIGYLGIIAKEIDGVINFLMQAKIEPGNVNCVQISPTIQATKSNFTRAHGGNLPLYFDWFENAYSNGWVIYDQIQSEQGSRFVGKRNRNIILLTDKDVPEHPNYKWMTLGQIKTLMKHDNLVNMDTRTVLSGLNIGLNERNGGGVPQAANYHFNDVERSLCGDFIKAYSMLNDYKMYHDVHKTFVPLNELVNWNISNEGLTCKYDTDFCVRYYNIEIQGREVQKWTQPLFKATANALFVLFTTINNGVREFLISLCPEIGCFDNIEFGPSIQLSSANYIDKSNSIHQLFLKHKDQEKNICADVILSEEGGRFYHEQNRNMIIQVDKNDLNLPPDYLWVTADTLNHLILNNNTLNIQLRNLMSLCDF